MRADRLRLQRRESDELQAGADGREVVASYTVLIGVVFFDVALRDLPPGWLL
jgi:hypothetical protein